MNRREAMLLGVAAIVTAGPSRGKALNLQSKDIDSGTRYVLTRGKCPLCETPMLLPVPMQDKDLFMLRRHFKYLETLGSGVQSYIINFIYPDTVVCDNKECTFRTTKNIVASVIPHVYSRKEIGNGVSNKNGKD